MSSRAFRRCVIGTSRHLERYERVVYRVERRRAVLRTAPASGVPSGQLRALPQAAGVSAWSVDRDALQRSSEVYAECPGCQGARQLQCAGCWSSSGWVPRSRGCQSCEKGWQRCVTCAGTGTVTAWLDVERSLTEHVRVHPEYMALRVHPTAKDPVDFDSEAHPGRLESDSGWVKTSNLARDALPAQLAEDERAVAFRSQSFVVAIHAVTYRIPQGRGTVEVAGRKPRELPLGNWRPLQLRVVSLCVATLLYVAAAVGVPLLLSRGSASEATFASAVAWGVGLATAFVLLLRSEALWYALKRCLPRRLGGQRARLPLTGVSEPYGTR